MQTIKCKGGYAVPVKEGMCSIVGYSAVVNSASTESRLTIVDKNPYETLGAAVVTDDDALKDIVIDHKGMASVDNTLHCMFPEPIKVTRGVTVVTASNLLPGKIVLYIK